MKRDYRLYLDDMLEAIGKIERYTKGLSYEQFRKESPGKRWPECGINLSMNILE